MPERRSSERPVAPVPPIFDQRFDREGLPPGWYTDTAFPNYRNGVWSCREWDGAIVPLPHDAWRVLRIVVDLREVGPQATAFCGTDGRTALTLDLGNGRSLRHQAVVGGLVVARGATPAPPGRDALRLVFEWTADTMQARVGPVTLLSAPNLYASAQAGQLHVGFRDCLVRRVAAFGTPLNAIPPQPRAIVAGYPLEVTVDFNDDLMPCAWTHRTFDALFTELKSWGARRVSWIDLGREADGFFDFAPLGIGEHARETQREVGDIFTAAVEHAHRHGIELVGILKPYDMAIQGYSWPPLSREAMKHGRIDRIGGSAGWATRMAAEHQDLIMARKPSAHGPARNTVWTRLDLVKDDDAESELSPEDISFIMSDDNHAFRPYEGPIACHELVEDYPIYGATPSGPRPTGRTRRARVFRFDGLAIREPYVAIQVRGRARSFSNRLCDLVHLFGENGEETHITYGLLPRRADLIAHPGDSAGAAPAIGPRGGFEFDRYPGSPSGSLTCGGDPIRAPLALDRGEASFIAFARGKDRGPLAVLSPSFPETRALWMTWITAMLEAGADGIDIRPGHHHADFAWCEYGFEAPVREDMSQRTGVDIWQTDAFDHALWRRVRGEGWTQFIREASAVVRGRGKPLTVHIDGHFDAAPSTGGAMNMVVNWAAWIEEGLIDRITGKALWPGAHFSREVVALAHANGIPVTYAPYGNNFFEDRRTMNHVGASPKGCERAVERLIEWGERDGYDHFLFYECASALRARPDGTIGFRPGAEGLGDVMRRHFRKSEGNGL